MTVPIRPVRDAAIETVRGRNWFYWSRNDGQQRAIMFLGIGLVMSLAANGWQLAQKPIIQNFVTDELGRHLEVYPVSEPILSRGDVTALAGRCVTNALTFNFKHYRHELEQAAGCFTPDGWSAFIAEISRPSGLLDKVVKDNLISTGNLRAAATVTDQGMVNGRYAWMVSVPILVTVEKEGRSATENWVAEVMLVRVSQVENRGGAAIDRIVIVRSGG